MATQLAVHTATPGTAVTSDWKDGLPVLRGNGITLRELRTSDATSLLALLTTEEVTRFISPPPTTIEGFERFILWAQREREAGRYACFAVVPDGYDTAVGLFQVRQLDPTFDTAEWGFAIGSEFWGTGLFVKGAELVVDFCVRRHWRPSPRGACGGAERPRQWRAPEDWRGSGGHLEKIIPSWRQVSRSIAVVHPRRGLVSFEGRVGTSR